MKQRGKEREGKKVNKRERRGREKERKRTEEI